MSNPRPSLLIKRLDWTVKKKLLKLYRFIGQPPTKFLDLKILSCQIFPRVVSHRCLHNAICKHPLPHHSHAHDVLL